MNYMTTQEAAEKWKISLRRVQVFCVEGRIPGAKQVGRQWMIPADCRRPPDGRTRQGKGRPAPVYRFPFLMYSGSYASGSELQEDEQQLLEAQIITLQGKYADSLARCRSLLSEDISPVVRFGAYASIAYNCVPLGLHSECMRCLEEMERLRVLDPAHDEDYRLLHAFLRMQFSFNVSELEAIQPEKLSPDAEIPYAAFTLQSLVLSSDKESAIALRVYSAFCRNLEDLGLLPTAMAVHGILAFLFGKLGDVKSHNAHVAAACRIGCEKGFLLLLSKYSALSPADYRTVLNAKDPHLAKKLEALRGQSQQSWRVVFNQLYSDTTFRDFHPEEGELLLLLSHGLSTRDIATCKQLSPGETKARIKALCARYNLGSKADLSAYARQIFSAVRDSADVQALS